VQCSQKEHVIGAVCWKKEEMSLQPLCWHCIECFIQHERDVRQRTAPTYMWCKQVIINRVIMACDFYCCLLPQCECEALCTCHSGFPTATVTDGKSNA